MLLKLIEFIMKWSRLDEDYMLVNKEKHYADTQPHITIEVKSPTVAV